MNCANHPDVAVSQYCRSCGKPLCASCVRNVQGVAYCEQCLAERLGAVHPPQAASAPYVAPAVYAGQPVAASGPNPALAGILGAIPFGVGAVYNGQYAKGLGHLVIFVLLVVGASFKRRFVPDGLRHRDSLFRCLPDYRRGEVGARDSRRLARSRSLWIGEHVRRLGIEIASRGERERGCCPGSSGKRGSLYAAAHSNSGGDSDCARLSLPFADGGHFRLRRGLNLAVRTDCVGCIHTHPAQERAPERD